MACICVACTEQCSCVPVSVFQSATESSTSSTASKLRTITEDSNASDSTASKAAAPTEVMSDLFYVLTVTVFKPWYNINALIYYCICHHIIIYILCS